MLTVPVSDSCDVGRESMIGFTSLHTSGGALGFKPGNTKIIIFLEGEQILLILSKVASS